MPQQQRAELERLSLATLQKLAAKVGVEQSDIFDAIDTRLPKDTLVATTYLWRAFLAFASKRFGFGNIECIRHFQTHFSGLQWIRVSG